MPRFMARVVLAELRFQVAFLAAHHLKSYDDQNGHGEGQDPAAAEKEGKARV